MLERWRRLTAVHDPAKILRGHAATPPRGQAATQPRGHAAHGVAPGWGSRARPRDRSPPPTGRRVNATLVTAHSDKEQTAPTFKRGYGHHPLTTAVDHGGERISESVGIRLHGGRPSSLEHRRRPHHPHPIGAGPASRGQPGGPPLGSFGADPRRRGRGDPRAARLPHRPAAVLMSSRVDGQERMDV